MTSVGKTKKLKLILLAINSANFNIAGIYSILRATTFNYKYYPNLSPFLNVYSLLENNIFLLGILLIEEH